MGKNKSAESVPIKFERTVNVWNFDCSAEEAFNKKRLGGFRNLTDRSGRMTVKACWILKEVPRWSRPQDRVGELCTSYSQCKVITDLQGRVDLRVFTTTNLGRRFNHQPYRAYAKLLVLVCCSSSHSYSHPGFQSLESGTARELDLIRVQDRWSLCFCEDDRLVTLRYLEAWYIYFSQHRLHQSDVVTTNFRVCDT